MLEKIGLPPKPFLKENDWVLDASHCQSCASAFSLFNFKHHCRRCGGLFCGNCTQQRMYLRGQGDRQVRICVACKNIEYATRFQPRTAPKNRIKGSAKSIISPDADIVLQQILGSEADSPNLGSGDFVEDENDGSPSIPSSSQGVSSRSAMAFVDEKEKESSITPQSLREAAQEEKKSWLALKKQGKTKEATKAFKRGKELEREAEALELSLRRNQRKELESTSQHVVLQDDMDIGRVKKSQSLPSAKRERETKKSLAMGEKDDLMGALKELGWSDAELHAEEKKQSKSVESELEVLAMATRSESHSEIAPSRVAGAPLLNEVLAHKRKALALKREGKMAEAKEELKKAKILEKQIEEQEMFGGGDEDSDEEFAALVRSIEKEGKAGKKGSLVSNDIPMDFDIGNLLSIGEEEADISDTDMGDPEMIAALKSMGWEEEGNALGEGGKHVGHGGKADPKRRNKPTKNGIIGMEGIPFSLNDDKEEHVEVTAQDMNDPDLLLALKAIGFAEEEQPSVILQPVIDMAKPSRREKANLQQQILAIKRDALSLKRAGKLEEAREELRKAKKMEVELQSEPISEELFINTSNKMITQQRAKSERAKSLHLGIVEDDLNTVENTLVSEEDMMDPELLKALESVGWQEDDRIVESKKATDTKHYSEAQVAKRKKEVQKELLSLKRSALKLRREGRKEEAEEELRKASELESVMQELESAELELKREMERGGKNKGREELCKAKKMEAEFQSKPLSEDPFVSTSGKTSNKTITQQRAKSEKAKSFHLGIVEDNLNDVENTLVSEEDMMDPELLKALESFGWQEDNGIADNKNATDTKRYSEAQIAKRKKEVQKDLLSLKRAAFKLRREGRKEEAEEELRKASELESVMQELESAELELKREKERGGKNAASGLPLDASLMETNSAVATFDPKLLGTLNDLGLVGELETELNHRNNSLLKSASGQRPTHSIDVEKPLQAKKYYSEAQVAKKKREVQKELLSVKRLALKLRREGRSEEAEEELNKSSELELLMRELECAELEFKRETRKNEALQVPANVAQMDSDSMVGTLDLDALATLKDLGVVVGSEVESNRVRNPLVITSTSTQKPSLEAKKYYSEAQVAKKKREVQKELLSVKRLALKFRREGRSEEAEEELNKSSELELLMRELECAELEFKGETGKNEASQVPANVAQMDSDSMVGTLDSDVLATLKDLGVVVGSEVESNHVRNPSVITSTSTQKPSLEDLRSRVVKPSGPVYNSNRREGGLVPLEPLVDVHQNISGGSDLLSGDDWRPEESQKGRDLRSRVVEPSGPVYNSNRREGGVVPLEPLVDVHQNISGGLDLLSGDDWRPEESQKGRGEIEKMGSSNASQKLDGNLDGNFNGVPKGNASRKFDGNSDGKLDNESDRKLDGNLGAPKKGNVSQKFDGMSDGKLDEKMDGKLAGKFGVPNKGSLVLESFAGGTEAVPPRVVASADGSPVHQVLEHKRKALMLKREGRIAEAKEELRQAKALEREMELASTMESTTPPMEDRKVKVKDEPASLVLKIERQSPPLKDMSIHETAPPVSQKHGRPGKDRFKLQQESLAHKRKALALRREGKAEEAEAEFELAKSIEMQMEEMDGGGAGVGVGLHEAESSVQDELLDPQLLAALKGLGLNPVDIVGSNTAKTTPSSSSSSKLPDTRERKPDSANVVRKPPPEASGSSQRDEKTKLMENIKAMKLRALQLKKAGKQSEALEALRSAKQLQNKLESMNS